ncbi:MAG: response regulator [bacterium]
MARLLVVDDVRFISQMIAGVFERMGHRVETAGDGEEALAKARATLPDLIIMDVAMPKLDGLEVARQLRADERTRDLPVLLVTSRSDPATLTAAAQAGVDDHLPKPFETASLVAKASRLLGGYPMSFSLELLGETAVVSALPEDLGAAVAEHVKPALEWARAAGTGPLLLDLTRVARVDPQVGEALLAFEETFRRDGGQLELVRPRPGVGVRAFLAQVSTRLKVHESIQAAHAALEIPPGTVGQPIPPKRMPHPVPSSRSAAPPPAPPHATVTGAARGVVVETHPQATIVRVHRLELDEDVMELVYDEIARGTRSILVEIAVVASLGERELSDVSALARKATEASVSLRFVNPTPEVEERLVGAGFGSLVLRTRGREDATRSSS